MERKGRDTEKWGIERLKMKVHEHNRIVFEPVLYWAGGMYRTPLERRVLEYDEEYEIGLKEEK